MIKRSLRTFISKVIEKAVSCQLIEHIESNDLREPLQSAYKRLHNTETALLKVNNDILNAIDRHRTVALLLLLYASASEVRPLRGLPPTSPDAASMLLSEGRILLIAV